MNIVTLSSKQQITLPQEILIQLAFEPGSKLLLETDKEKIVLTPIKKSIVDQLGGSLARYVALKKRGVAFEQVLKETKSIVAKKLAQDDR